MCCVFQYKLAVKFASEAGPQFFLACSSFLGNFEPRCSYKIVVIKKKRVCHESRDIQVNTEVLETG